MIMKDDEGKSRGFGFINFDDADAAHAAVEALNGKEDRWQGAVRWARPEEG